MESLNQRFFDHEVGNLLSAVGNGESKALLLTALRPNKIYTRPDLQELLLRIQGRYTKEGWEISKGLGFQYCRDSMAPIGLVAKEVLNPDLSEYGYIKAEYGERVGVPFVGHLADLSERYSNTSLFEVWGGTGSVSPVLGMIEQEGMTAEYRKRSPIIRLKIFWEILTSKLPLREADLVTALEEEQGIIADHLKKLRAFRLIEYDALGPNKPGTYYTLADSEKEPIFRYTSHHGMTTLKRHLYLIFFSHPKEDLTYDKLWEYFKAAAPLRQKSKQAFIRRASIYLAQWSRDGFLTEGIFNNNTQSQIDLTDAQRALLNDFVETVDKFQKGDSSFLDEGRSKAEEIINDPKRVAVLMRKARNKSPFARRFYKDSDS